MVSVVICTRNRAASLARALASLAAMEIAPGLAWELIVVDNGSQDATREVVEEFARATGLNVRYVFEAVQGLSRARNRALREARGEIVAFTDDDMLVDRRWLVEINREFGADPRLGVLTGRTVMLSSDKPEIAVTRSTAREYHRFPSNPRRIGGGNNMALRVSAVAKIGLFDDRLGPGRRNWVGEDTDYFYRAMKAGQKVLFSPELLAFHDHDRTTPEAVIRTRLGYVSSWGALLCKHALGGDRWMARLLISEGRRLLGVAFRQGAPGRPWALRRLLALYAGAAQWIFLLMRERLRRGRGEGR